MKTKFTLLVSIFCMISLHVFSQWTDSGSTIYTNDNVGIGTSSTSGRTLQVYKTDYPYFGIKNEYGSIDIGVAHGTNDYATDARPGDAAIKLHSYSPSYPYHGLFINLNDNNEDGNSFVKFCDTNGTIMAVYNNNEVKIDGKLYAKEIEVKTNVWADYVFKPNYNLMSLTDLERFIKANNHLPDVPSTSEVKDKGINLADMNAKLLQKVEELTLYIIKQQKQIDELSQNMTSTSN